MASLRKQEHHFFRIINWIERVDDMQVWSMSEFVALRISRNECWFKVRLLGAGSYYGVAATLALQHTLAVGLQYY